MKTSTLKSYFENRIAFSDLIDSIHAEVMMYSDRMKHPGSTIPLNFVEDEQMHVTRNDFRRLLNDFAVSETSTVALSYICDCLTLAERISHSDNALSEMIFDIADPEINGGYKSGLELTIISKNIE